MFSFEKPNPPHNYNADSEIQNLRTHKKKREIPNKSKDHIIIATWNIANFGLQKRRDSELELIAEMLSWFDIVGLQEIHDNLHHLRAVLDMLPKSYRIVFNDRAGNDERSAFVYDSRKISELEMVGEVAVPPSENRHIKLPGIDRKFKGFDRNPFFVSFVAGDFEFVIANVHLYFGDDNKKDRERRALEAYAAARWADLRRDDSHSYSENFMVLGDFNLPKAEHSDPIYRALTKRGMHRPPHSTRVASNIVDDKEYDQIFFFPGNTKKRYTGESGVFDFDGAVYPDLWDKVKPDEEKFRKYIRYYLSDHRPLWAQFKT
ncbi:endonuclease/exonuclease/phosphatase family protein [Nitrosopumilus sp.]|uniref:endonuclease/exonuclease/phosphatase family protein n=1 Tax=Nitrosopumilus sp. TaxID=2024843 RepID=UPI00247BB9CD|nr:endonuclease/exonuclease/phosphatase family protein [Nitrosopumilus sp.]MCV0430645.1 endonuclease/exonuclease/phosphatase family protein [Nitrosopumilus sp.]